MIGGRRYSLQFYLPRKKIQAACNRFSSTMICKLSVPPLINFARYISPIITALRSIAVEHGSVVFRLVLRGHCVHGEVIPQHPVPSPACTHTHTPAVEQYSSLRTQTEPMQSARAHVHNTNLPRFIAPFIFAAEENRRRVCRSIDVVTGAQRVTSNRQEESDLTRTINAPTTHLLAPRHTTKMVKSCTTNQ